VKQVVDNIKSLSQKTWHDPVKGIYENSDEWRYIGRKLT
jgi:hypothetical protein